MKTDVRTKSEPKGNKKFLRLDKPFNDAVRANNKAAVVDVLLRAKLSGKQARRTADKILADSQD